MSQIERIYWIDAEIRAGHFPNAHTVAAIFEVTTRVAYNDRLYLRNRLRAPLETDRNRGGWYYTDPTFMLPFLALTEREATALRRLFLLAQEYLPTADAELLRQVADKMSAFTPKALPGGHERIRGSVHLTGGLSGDLLQACDRAVALRQRLQILYYSVRRNEISERIIQPYELLVWRGEPHLIGFCEWRQAMRQFFLGRVREWKLLPGEAAYTRDPDFDIDAYLLRGLDLEHGEEMVTVRARFSPYQARWIRERRYHPSQETEELEDGGLLLTLRVAGTAEVRRWLLGYGREVEILEPASLRQEIAEEIHILRNMYGRDSE
jgi:predicted DNA-binding transcriptional regulator YafY